jgi:hypothetical protein
MRLVEANGMTSNRVETSPEKGEKFEVDGWLEKVAQEKAKVAADLASKKV